MSKRDFYCGVIVSLLRVFMCFLNCVFLVSFLCIFICCFRRFYCPCHWHFVEKQLCCDDLLVSLLIILSAITAFWPPPPPHISLFLCVGCVWCKTKPQTSISFYFASTTFITTIIVHRFMFPQLPTATVRAWVRSFQHERKPASTGSLRSIKMDEKVWKVREVEWRRHQLRGLDKESKRSCDEDDHIFPLFCQI